MALVSNPYTGGGATLFYAATLLVAAWRAQPGCEVTAISNLILGRDDQVGCPMFAPIDEVEAGLRRKHAAGAAGFLVKDAPAERLANAIRRAAAGERVVDPELAATALAEGESPFTPREREVLEASAGGARSQRSPNVFTSRRERCGTTSQRRSARPARATESRRFGQLVRTAGSEREAA